MVIRNFVNWGKRDGPSPRYDTNQMVADMPQLGTALHRHAHPKTAEDTDTVGAAA